MIDRRTMLGLLLALVPAAACARPARAARLDIYKSPYCGCCTAWVDHVKAAGFDVHVVETDDVSPVARKLGVPDELRSCHTAQVAGYFIEGHVPAADIHRLLRDRPAARGLAVPGMPIGSPGMDQAARRDPFATLLVDRKGKSTVFARHNQGRRLTS